MNFEVAKKLTNPRLLTQSIGDAEIKYLLYDGPGKNLILLQATGFPPELWHPIAEELCRFYRIVVPFYYDHREAKSSDEGISWLLLAQDLKAFCDALQIKNPLVVGHSMGGTVAAISEAECGLNAGALILIEPIFLIEELYRIMSRVEDHPLAIKSRNRTNHWQDEEDLRQYLKAKPLFQTWAEEMLEGYIRYGFEENTKGGLQLKCPPEKEVALLMGGIKNNPWPLFPHLSCPVLILEGEKSENRIYAELSKASSLIPLGSYVLVKGAGHLIPMERPKEMITTILNFFREVFV